jgi:hypothetical protein
MVDVELAAPPGVGTIHDVVTGKATGIPCVQSVLMFEIRNVGIMIPGRLMAVKPGSVA